MKKRYRLPVLLISLVLLTVGCKEREEKNNITPTPDGTVTATPAPTAKPTATLAPTATPIPTPTAEPTPTPLPDVRDVFEKTDYSGVYRLKLELEDILLSCDVNMVGGTPIIAGSTDDYRALIYAVDPMTGTYKQFTYSEDSMDCTFMRIDDERFAVRNYSSEKFNMYDTELNGLGTVSGWSDYENVLLDEGGETVWAVNEGCLIKRDRAGNVVKEFEYDERLLGGYMSDYDERRFITVECYDEYDSSIGPVIYDVNEWRVLQTDGNSNRFFVNPEGTETLLVCDDDVLFAGLYEGGIEDCFALQDSQNTDDTEADAEPELIRKEPKTELRLNGNGETYISFVDWTNRVYITSTTYFSSVNTVFEIKAYSLDTGELTAEYAIGMGTDYVWPALSLDQTRGVLFFTCGRPSDLTLYCWDYMNDTEDDSEDAFAKLSAIPDYIEEKRRNFEEKYNIRLYIGSEVFASPFDYRLTICNDWAKVEDGIDTLDEVFGNYPDGFFDQMKVNNIKTLGIYICSGFEKLYDYSADDAIALACVFGYERALAIDMEYRYCLERTIVHEVSHWIDGRIEAAQAFGKCVNYEDDWNALLPEGYEYKNSYVSGKTVWKYIYNNAELEDVYFCDEYSQTYPGEDRARCFEYLMYGEEDGYMYMDAPHIQEKLALYFKYIREAFDDSTWPEQTSWEEKLDYYINDWTPEGDELFDDYDEDDYGEWVG